MYRLIVVPLDGTPFGEHALPVAASIARAGRCPVHLVHVQIPPALGTELAGAAALDARQREEMRIGSERYLRALTAEMAAVAGISVTPVVLDGGLPDELRRHVEQSGADLVVMTTHNRNLLERVLLGSVAESVVRTVSAPVLLARGADEPPTLDRPRALTRLLIPLDGSAFAEQVIPHAAALATLMRAEVTLLSVVDPTLAAASAAAGAGDAALAPRPDSEQGAAFESAFLERAAQPLRAQGLAVRATVLADRQPAHAIVGYAAEHAIDLIAMTTHGRGTLRRLVAGSVAERVLHTSAAAMLMYRPSRE